MFINHTPSQHSLDRAAAKGWARGLAASDPNRIIRVNLSSFSVPPATLGLPRWISFATKQGTSINDVLTEIHSRLPEIAHPYTITTLGADAREVRLGDEHQVAGLLQHFESESLSLRMVVDMPKPPAGVPKKGLMGKLKGALKSSGESSSAALPPTQLPAQGGKREEAEAEAASSRASVVSAPPPYEDAIRSGPQRPPREQERAGTSFFDE